MSIKFGGELPVCPITQPGRVQLKCVFLKIRAHAVQLNEMPLHRGLVLGSLSSAVRDSSGVALLVDH